MGRTRQKLHLSEYDVRALDSCLANRCTGVTVKINDKVVRTSLAVISKDGRITNRIKMAAELSRFAGELFVLRDEYLEMTLVVDNTPIVLYRSGKGYNAKFIRELKSSRIELTAISLDRAVIQVINEDGNIVEYAQRGVHSTLKQVGHDKASYLIRAKKVREDILDIPELPINIKLNYESCSGMGKIETEFKLVNI